jgi:hypothetical protein
MNHSAAGSASVTADASGAAKQHGNRSSLHSAATATGAREYAGVLSSAPTDIATNTNISESEQSLAKRASVRTVLSTTKTALFFDAAASESDSLAEPARTAHLPSVFPPSAHQPVLYLSGTAVEPSVDTGAGANAGRRPAAAAAAGGRTHSAVDTASSVPFASESAGQATGALTLSHSHSATDKVSRPHRSPPRAYQHHSFYHRPADLTTSAQGNRLLAAAASSTTASHHGSLGNHAALANIAKSHADHGRIGSGSFGSVGSGGGIGAVVAGARPVPIRFPLRPAAPPALGFAGRAGLSSTASASALPLHSTLASPLQDPMSVPEDFSSSAAMLSSPSSSPLPFAPRVNDAGGNFNSEYDPHSADDWRIRRHIAPSPTLIRYSPVDIVRSNASPSPPPHASTITVNQIDAYSHGTVSAIALRQTQVSPTGAKSPVTVHERYASPRRLVTRSVSPTASISPTSSSSSSSRPNSAATDAPPLFEESSPLPSQSSASPHQLDFASEQISAHAHNVPPLAFSDVASAAHAGSGGHRGDQAYHAQEGEGPMDVFSTQQQYQQQYQQQPQSQQHQPAEHGLPQHSFHHVNSASAGNVGSFGHSHSTSSIHPVATLSSAPQHPPARQFVLSSALKTATADERSHAHLRSSAQSSPQTFHRSRSTSSLAATASSTSSFASAPAVQNIIPALRSPPPLPLHYQV